MERFVINQESGEKGVMHKVYPIRYDFSQAHSCLCAMKQDFFDSSAADT